MTSASGTRAGEALRQSKRMNPCSLICSSAISSNMVIREPATSSCAVQTSTEFGPFAGIGLAEDIDWGRRARAAGLTFRYVPEMIVFHPPRRSIGELCIKWDRHLRHYINMARGTPLWRLRWSLRALAILISPMADGFKVFTSDRVHGVPARLKALAVLVAIRSYRAWKMIVLLWSRNEVMWNCEVEVSLPDVE